MYKKTTNRTLAIDIVKRLRNKGFQAYFAGGCVRDMLLGIRPKDYDIATDAHPEQVCELFPRTLKVGAKFGVVMVMNHKKTVEVATFRTETGYHDGRHPSSVHFASLKEDAIRRDFTINGLYYDPLEEKVIDYVDGQNDLKKNLIRAIGDAHQRFSEDYLRMLRAVRFSSRFQFDIEPETQDAIIDNAHKIKNISRERISLELEGILTHPNRRLGTELFIETGLAGNIFKDYKLENKRKVVAVLSMLPRNIDFALSLAAFFLFEPTSHAMSHCKALKLSRNQLKHIRFLLENFEFIDDYDMPLADLKMLVAEPYFDDLYNLKKAFLKSCNMSLGNLKKLKTRINSLEGKELKPAPILNGHQLIELGARPGPQVGHLSRELYIAQLSEHIETVSQAKKWAKNWLKKHENPK